MTDAPRSALPQAGGLSPIIIIVVIVPKAAECSSRPIPSTFKVIFHTAITAITLKLRVTDAFVAVSIGLGCLPLRTDAIVVRKKLTEILSFVADVDTLVFT